MKITRKQFLKFSGACLVAFSGKKVLALLDETNPLSAASTTTATPKRWGMLVDIRKCFKAPDCTRCIAACDHAHNVPSIANPLREVKWIWKEPFESVFSADQTQYLDSAVKNEAAMVMCNHCDNPPCVRVCPTGATWKRPEDGIVMMDWHRCIGCRYCMAACPYGSRSFNWSDPRPLLTTINADFPTRTKGVVEKCTFCPERLAKGELPACVAACPEKALMFGDLNDRKSGIRQTLASNYVLRRKPELGTGPNIFYLI